MPALVVAFPGGNGEMMKCAGQRDEHTGNPSVTQTQDGR
jgi:hypothetical protein